MIDHSSARRFSTGVPVSATRRLAFRARIVVVCLVGGFLMYCASSSTTRCQFNWDSVSRSRLTSP